MLQKDREWFRVEVSDHDGQIVAIAPEMLAGRDIGEAERDKISKAIEHLSGFIGYGRPQDTDDDLEENDSDYCECGAMHGEEELGGICAACGKLTD